MIISDSILHQANMSEPEFKLELALFLYSRSVLTLGKASEFAGITQYEFQQALNAAGVSLSYDEEEFRKDYARIKRKYHNT